MTGSNRTSLSPRFPTLAVLALLLTLGPAVAQSTNDAFGRLVINGVDGAPPNHVGLEAGDPVTIQVSGGMNRTFVLVFAPAVNVNELGLGPGISLDVGPLAATTIVMNGFDSPTANLLNLFANTGSSGVQTMSFTLPQSAPLGLFGAFQAFVVDFTIPGFVAATAASEVEIGLDFQVGDAVYTAALTGLDQSLVTLPQGGQPTPAAPPLADFRFEEIGLAGFGDFYRNDTVGVMAQPFGPPIGNRGALARRRAPVEEAPIFAREQGGPPRIKTAFGDLFHFFDCTSGSFGFFLQEGTTPARVLTATLRPAMPQGTSPWRALVALEGNLLAAVEQVTLADRVHLIRLDGSIFPGSGTEDADISPATLLTSIADRSLTFFGGRLFLVGGDLSTATSQLLAAPTTGATAATTVPLPNLAPGVPVTFVGPELRRENGRLLARTANGDPGTRARLVNVNAGTTITISQVTPISPLRTMPSLGVAGGGTDNRVAVSPDGTRIAWVANENTSSTSSEELIIGQPAGGGIVFASTSSLLVAAIDTIREPMWIDSDSLLFWAGTTETELDLYRFRISAPAVIENLTRTNGQSGLSLPISATPPARIDPAGQFRHVDRLIFARGGLSSAGLALGQAVLNLIGVPFSTLVPYNITGDEFIGPIGVNTVGSATALELAFSATTDRMWFKARPVGSMAEDLFTFDPAVASPAQRFATSSQITGGLSFLEPLPDGSRCLFATTNFQGGGPAVLEATVAGGGLQVRLQDAGATSFSDLRRLQPSAPVPGFLYVRRTGSLIVLGSLHAFDESLSQSTLLVPQGLFISLIAN